MVLVDSDPRLAATLSVILQLPASLVKGAAVRRARVQ